MKSLHTSLLREKFEIFDPGSLHGKSTCALSNRIVLPLENARGQVIETFTIRAQNMHGCVRFASYILEDYEKYGPILNRHSPINLQKYWERLENDFEHTYNPDLWVSVYNEGKIFFKAGNIHPFLNLIEKCDHEAPDSSYEEAAATAEAKFTAAGQNISITYDGNVALVVNFDRKETRCGIILRSADRTTTFNFSVDQKTKGDDRPNFSRVLMAASNFLEGMQLAFMAGMNHAKIDYGIIKKKTHEERQTQAIHKRLAMLEVEINNMENAYAMRYRPERPDFRKSIVSAEKFGRSILKPID